MSRIGKKPVAIPSGVTATIDGQSISVKGPKGTLAFKATDDVTIAQEDGAITVSPRGTSKNSNFPWPSAVTVCTGQPIPPSACG